ncbi:MAG TPA: hypothetical protein VKX96_14305, partial [Chloroflexota bacterium]|nr:hypothetical protein [Chloroflexota bacterium]
DLLTYPQSFLLEQIVTYNTLYKPTAIYPFIDFWSIEDASVSAILASAGIIPGPVDIPAWQSALIPEFVENTFARLGWKVPTRPPWLPDNWSGKVGQPPYPPYLNVTTLKQPQTWPEPGDVLRPWKFAGTTYYP